MVLRAGTPVEHLHLTFGPDPAGSMTVSWTTPLPVRRPRVRFGTPPDGLDREVHAITRVHADAGTGEKVIIHHAVLTGLEPDSLYLYEVTHDRIARADGGTLRTAPSGRARFTFTGFGDQGTSASYDPFGTPASGHVVAGIERIGPLFNLVVGDLSYANQRRNPLRAWSDWFNMISGSARQRPWMPAAGNHEIERGNGPHGLAAYQSRFLLPGNGDDSPDSGTNGTGPDLTGLWYAFTVGGVRFVVLQNDDVCYQDAGMMYVRGYSGGRQRAWLERTLRHARADPAIDWIVVCMHQTAVSSAERHNGADLGIREEWLPLFDAFGVDLVLCGHEHHYERTHPLRGVVDGSEVLTPRPVPTGNGAVNPGDIGTSDIGTTVIDTVHGTVHMVVGTGGSSSPSAGKLFDPPAGRVIVGGEPRDGDPTRYRPIHVREPAPWSAVRAPDHPYAFAAFEVDPGESGGTTRIAVTVYDSSGPEPVPFDTFALVRPRADATGQTRTTPGRKEPLTPSGYGPSILPNRA
ncbi:metallophosphoesterase family protein [Frankia sp. Cppng1_Ct_nod]|uniref:purple acid phosphatase family protein n=1 Tax=Frankia sp. Cppng1_Ct_nod TaxID=2897162 RepID=UPI002025A66E|nr:metallophosphoesterase family protein [Frankia sp. Cppng1_Ct_nod]